MPRTLTGCLLSVARTARVGALALAVLPLFSQETPLAPTAKNWTLPLFSPEGYHTLSLAGAQVKPVGADRIDAVDLSIIVFTGGADARVETVITSPEASFFMGSRSASGSKSVRLIRDEVEASGEGWTYHDLQKRVVLARHTHVVFHAAMPNLLK